MYLVMLIMITFASTADSFIIGFHYGIKKTKIDNLSNLYISIITFIGTFASMHFGNLLSTFFSENVENMIGGIVLMGLAIYMLINAMYPQKNTIQNLSDKRLVKENKSNSLEGKEALLIGIMLSLNNVGMGIGAGITGMPVFITPLACGIANFIFIKSGSALGNLIHAGRLSKCLEIISAVFVFFLGILGFFN